MNRKEYIQGKGRPSLLRKVTKVSLENNRTINLIQCYHIKQQSNVLKDITQFIIECVRKNDGNSIKSSYVEEQFDGVLKKSTVKETEMFQCVDEFSLYHFSKKSHNEDILLWRHNYAFFYINLDELSDNDIEILSENFERFEKKDLTVDEVMRMIEL